jgi:hypothetical protein
MLTSHSQIGADIVTITVGSALTAATFKIHKKILCQKIPYFDKMFNGGWIETEKKSANMPDDDPKAFKLLLGWVYLGKIEVPTDANGPVDSYIELFAMAEKFTLSRLADEVIEYLNAMMKAENLLPGTTQMVKAYQRTPSGSRLRLLMAHCCVFITLSYTDDLCNNAWSKDKLQTAFKENDDHWSDVLSLMRSQSGKIQLDPRKRPACDYHQHTSTRLAHMPRIEGGISDVEVSTRGEERLRSNYKDVSHEKFG